MAVGTFTVSLQFCAGPRIPSLAVLGSLQVTYYLEKDLPAHLEWGVTMKHIPDTHRIGSGQAEASRKPALRAVKMVVCGGRLMTLL